MWQLESMFKTYLNIEILQVTPAPIKGKRTMTHYFVLERNRALRSSLLQGAALSTTVKSTIKMTLTYSPSSYSLVMHNFKAKYWWNVPGHKCAVQQAASPPLWTYDKCLCVWFSECRNEGTWKRKMIQREWTHGDGRSWESFTHEQLSDCGNFQKFHWLLETWATLCFCSLPRTHSPVAEVPEEIGVVHLQLLSWHIRSKVLGRTVG